MTSINIKLIKSSRAPNLPLAPTVYDSRAVDMYSNILRLYFNTLDNITSAILGVVGMTSLSAPYGSFIDTSTVAAGLNTDMTVLFNGGNANSSQVYIGTPTSRIYMTNAGVYNYQFSLQLTNSAVQINAVTVWIRVNGVDKANSSRAINIPVIRGVVNSAVTLALNYVVSIQAGGYIELIWTANDTAVSLATLPASAGAPVYPAAPAAIATVTFVSALPA